MPLAINLVGANTISSEAAAGICVVGDSEAPNDLSITGDGQLTVTNAKNIGIAAFSGVSIAGTVTTKGGTDA